MNMKEAKIYPRWEDVVEFGVDGPVHKKLADSPHYRSVIVGMEKSQAIPPHGAKAATYHFIQGSGRLTAGGEELEVGPGATVVVPEGVPRGIEADTRLVFLASHGSSAGTGRKPIMKMPVAVLIGMLVMMGIMAGVMFGPTVLMSRLGVSAVGMKGLMYLPLAGMALMAVTMFFFFRRMAGKGGGMMKHMMGIKTHSEDSMTKTPSVETQTAVFDVPSVSCAHCKITIETELGRLPGVDSVNVDVKKKNATVHYNQPATPTAIESKLTEIGYPSTTRPNTVPNTV